MRLRNIAGNIIVDQVKLQLRIHELLPVFSTERRKVFILKSMQLRIAIDELWLGILKAIIKGLK